MFSMVWFGLVHQPLKWFNDSVFKYLDHKTILFVKPFRLSLSGSPSLQDNLCTMQYKNINFCQSCTVYRFFIMYTVPFTCTPKNTPVHCSISVPCSGPPCNISVQFCIKLYAVNTSVHLKILSYTVA